MEKLMLKSLLGFELLRGVLAIAHSYTTINIDQKLSSPALLWFKQVWKYVLTKLNSSAMVKLPTPTLLMMFLVNLVFANRATIMAL
jgi:hypothetical protein